MNTGKYIPPYTVSGRSMNLIAEIAAAIERYRIILEGPDGVRLRKINHIRTIRGTTAIEGNTLTEAQITAILAGKRVFALSREIAEVKGAHAAYAMLGKIDPFSIPDVLKVHSTMMEGLVKGAGAFRTGGVGVVDGRGHVLHMAPPAARVPALCKDLIGWAKTSAAHPLIKSCVFHYEFEFIHPFVDGNGRMGRFLQTAMLGKWNPLFHVASVENIVFENQDGYYNAINASTAKADSGPFIDFMLDKILRALEAKGKAYEVAVVGTVPMPDKKTIKKSSQKSSQKILAIMKSMPDVTLTELANATGLSVVGVRWNIRKLKEANLTRRVGPDKGGHWEVRRENETNLANRAATQDAPIVTTQVDMLLRSLDGELDAATLQSEIGLKDRRDFMRRYILPALAAGLIERTIPEKPTSRFQKYRLTAKGRAALAAHA